MWSAVLSDGRGGMPQDNLSVPQVYLMVSVGSIAICKSIATPIHRMSTSSPTATIQSNSQKNSITNKPALGAKRKTCLPEGDLFTPCQHRLR